MDCKYFDGCSAPLCPRDEGAANCTWFPDEDICRLNNSPEWVKRQRKISGFGLSGEAGYFTKAMLEHPCRITKGLKGISPDGTDKERERDGAAWFTAHPAITAEERERMKARGEKNQVALSLHRASKTAFPPCPDEVPAKKGIQVPPSGNRPKNGLFLV